MISNQALQNTIDGIKGISHLEIGILDSQGREIAVTAPVFSGLENTVTGFAESEADSQQSGQYQFFKVFDEDQLEYVVCVCGGCVVSAASVTVSCAAVFVSSAASGSGSRISSAEIEPPACMYVDRSTLPLPSASR